MPMMRDMRLRSILQRLGQVLDHRAEVGPGGERLPAGGEDPRALLVRRGIPGHGEGLAQAGLLRAVAGPKAVSLFPEARSARRIETALARLLERLLDLEHLGE